MEYIDYMLWMSYLKNMWYKKVDKLLGYFVTPENIFKASKKTLENSGLLKDQEIDEILESRRKFDKGMEREKLEMKNIRFLTCEDDLFPEKLKFIEDKPWYLFCKGRDSAIERLNTPSAAIIGARVCTQYGIYAADKFAGELARYGVNIISGMARGIDSAAHGAAIENGGNTVAVFGCGVDVCYPPENRNLYENIIKSGAILSEYPPGTGPKSWQFPQRNRIISGLSNLVLITEAKEKSGTFITAKWALDQGIDVCAVPGRINDPLSVGCNCLIREGAIPVNDVSDMLILMGVNYKIYEKSKIILEKENEVVYSVLDLQPQTVDEIIRKTGMNSDAVFQCLIKLQMEGIIDEPVKNSYIRIK